MGEEEGVTVWPKKMGYFITLAGTLSSGLQVCRVANGTSGSKVSRSFPTHIPWE